MQVKVHFGANAGSVIDYPYHVGRALVEAGRGTRVDGGGPDGEAAAPPIHRATATVPAIAHRDPQVTLPVDDPRAGVRRRRRR